MEIANLHRAKTYLSQLIEKALRGEHVVIAKNGHPLVRLVPCVEKTKKRKLGVWSGKMSIAENFDEELPDEILKTFVS